MSEVCTFHPGDTVYCLDQEKIPIRGTITRVDALCGVVYLMIKPEAAVDQRDTATIHQLLYLPGELVYNTYEALIDAQIERCQREIKHWEDQRKKEFLWA